MTISFSRQQQPTSRKMSVSHAIVTIAFVIREFAGPKLFIAPRSGNPFIHCGTWARGQDGLAAGHGAGPALAAARRRTMTAVNWAIMKPDGIARTLSKHTPAMASAWP